MKPIYEKDLEEAFVRGLNQIINKNYARRLESQIDKELLAAQGKVELETLDTRLKALQEQAFQIATEFKDNAIDINTYTYKINKTMADIDKISTEIELLRNKSEIDKLHKHTMEHIRKIIKTSLKEFDKDIFRAIIDEVIIINQVQAKFILKTGMDFTESL